MDTVWIPRHWSIDHIVATSRERRICGRIANAAVMKVAVSVVLNKVMETIIRQREGEMVTELRNPVSVKIKGHHHRPRICRVRPPIGPQSSLTQTGCDVEA
jgi:hypothetical protein